MRKLEGRTAGSALATAALALTLGYAEPAVALSDEELAAAALNAVLEHVIGGPDPLSGHLRLEAYFVSRRGSGAPVLCGWATAYGGYPLTFASGGTHETTITWDGLEFLFSGRWVELCRGGG